VKRREFITLLSGAAAWPIGARAQQPERMQRIGMLTDANPTDQFVQSMFGVIRQRLRELGWDDRRNVSIEERWAGLDGERLKAYAAELVSLEPNAIFGIGTPVISSLQQASRSIPIVFMNENVPVAVEIGRQASIASGH
jgi:putative ABC transport system substrate-binding protein